MTDYGCIKSAFMGDDPVCKIYQGDELIYSIQKDWSKEYFTIEALEDGVLLMHKRDASYRINGGEWIQTALENEISLNENDIMEVKGNSKSWNFSFSGNTFRFNVCGNIDSLINGDNFSGKTDVVTTAQMFRDCSGLIDASNLVLPATTLENACYASMFSNCTSLTGTPELPATTLAESCYGSMFANCSSLTTTPALSATTLARSCYNGMFAGCTSITTAPALTAKTLADECYRSMFHNCSSLAVAPELPATTLANGCYNTMFAGCSSLATPPILRAETLANTCYANMFLYCPFTSLVCLATDISATNCTFSWLNSNVPGTFYKNPLMNDWTKPSIGVTAGVPVRWDIVDYQE